MDGPTWTSSGEPWVSGLQRSYGPPLPSGEVNLETGERRMFNTGLRFGLVFTGHVQPEELAELRKLHGYTPKEAA